MYTYQEVVRLDNKNTSFSAAAQHMMMSCLLMIDELMKICDAMRNEERRREMRMLCVVTTLLYTNTSYAILLPPSFQGSKIAVFEPQRENKSCSSGPPAVWVVVVYVFGVVVNVVCYKGRLGKYWKKCPGIILLITYSSLLVGKKGFCISSFSLCCAASSIFMYTRLYPSNYIEKRVY